MKTLTLAEALTFKKRVVEELNATSEAVKAYNSAPVFGGGPSAQVVLPTRDGVDVKAQAGRRDRLKSYLIDLKLNLWRASEPIRGKVLRLAELKDDAAFWKGLDTKHGTHKGEYTREVETYDAVFRKPDVDGKGRDIRANIDRLQAEIDAFNHATKIEVEDIGI